MTKTNASKTHKISKVTTNQSAKKQEIALILDNIRSVHNVGSIFRTAEAGGVSRIFCVGTTPTPIDRFGLARKDFAKVSLGAENMVPYEHTTKVAEAIRKLRSMGYKIYALELVTGAKDFRKMKKTNNKIALILGNEVDGVSKTALRLCDEVYCIPMRGRKESLNVSVAAGIGVFCGK
jgi:tRNA G18 (ribose-2'-O)-methylase SpoU